MCAQSSSVLHAWQVLSSPQAAALAVGQFSSAVHSTHLPLSTAHSAVPLKRVQSSLEEQPAQVPESSQRGALTSEH
jgi:hypothetical protein